MAGVAEWTTDHVGMRTMLKSPGITAKLLEVGNSIAAHARSIAPVGVDPDEHPGMYRDSFGVRSEPRPDRAQVLVFNSAPHAVYVEYGTSSTEAHHTLARAASEGHGL